MINWSDVDLLEKQKKEKEIELNTLLKSSNFSIDKVNELKSDILYLNKQIKKIVGSNELSRQKEIKIKKSNERRLSNYYAFKERYKKISRISSSIKKNKLVPYIIFCIIMIFIPKNIYKLNFNSLEKILDEKKGNQNDKITFNKEKIEAVLPKELLRRDKRYIEEYIIKAIEYYIKKMN